METQKIDYICYDCGEPVEVREGELLDLADVIRIQCIPCQKDFMMGLKADSVTGQYYAYTYKLMDGKAIYPVLKELLVFVSLPLPVVDEMLRHVKFNRWGKFVGLVREHYNVISKNRIIMHYLNENGIFQFVNAKDLMST